MWAFPLGECVVEGCHSTVMCTSLCVNVPVCMSVLMWVCVSEYKKMRVHEFLSVLCV